MTVMRLQKYLSEAGICSRRKAEEYIAEGLVRINGAVATIGQSIDPEKDRVEIDDTVVKRQENFVYYKLNKPRGVVTTCAQPWEKTILDILDVEERVFPIGRLDKDTTGLILLTNDGRLSNYLMHPRYGHEKEYVVHVYGAIEDEALERMRRGGIRILEQFLTSPAGVRRINSGAFAITLGEGKNRQIRRMVEAVGHEVKRLRRIRIENIHLADLPEGAYAPLSAREKRELMARIGPDRERSISPDAASQKKKSAPKETNGRHVRDTIYRSGESGARPRSEKPSENGFRKAKKTNRPGA